MSHRTRQLFLLLLTFPLLIAAIYFANCVYQNSAQRTTIKNDYSTINSVSNGIMSVNVWKKAITHIVGNQIENFELTESQDSLLHLKLTLMIQHLIDKADHDIQANSHGFKGTIRKWAVHTFIHPEKIRARVPHFSREIIDEATKEKNKKWMKKLAISKLDEFAEKTYDKKDSTRIKTIYNRYNLPLDADISKVLITKAQKLENMTYRAATYILIIIGIYLLFWFFVLRYNGLQKTLFFMSVALAIVVLIVGLTSSMIEIDARINKVDFVLMGEHVKFTNQVIFYRSKSILQLVKILFKTGKIDTVFVGFLVLSFSIILPISKLLSTEIYLFGKEKWRSNRLLHWLAFKSGKWSMADVMVVAIFMAYVGFNGILDTQMADLNIKSSSFTSIATNYTSLQPGYILFIAYVVFGLILSVILQRIIKKQENNC